MQFFFNNERKFCGQKGFSIACTSVMMDVGSNRGILNRKELDELDIHYHHLAVTDKKAEYILREGITVFFDGTSIV